MFRSPPCTAARAAHRPGTLEMAEVRTAFGLGVSEDRFDCLSPLEFSALFIT